MQGIFAEYPAKKPVEFRESERILPNSSAARRTRNAGNPLAGLALRDSNGAKTRPRWRGKRAFGQGGPRRISKAKGVKDGRVQGRYGNCFSQFSTAAANAV